ncbi:hypothetical protein ABVT39_024006 [Epinephelus coioides]
MFAHWTDTSKAILQDEVSLVFKLKKRKMDDITEVRFLGVQIGKKSNYSLLHSLSKPVCPLHSLSKPVSLLHSLSKPVCPLHSLSKPESLLHSLSKPDKLEIKIVHDCKRPAEWVETNQHLFSGKVELPDAVQMGEEELTEAAQQYVTLWVQEESADMDDQEKEGILEPFKFLFSKIEDMWTFCGEMSDKQGYLTYCEGSN